MSRLLHAAARGARLEVMGNQVKDWEIRPVAIALFWQHQGYMVRIHPEDAHLQYGPISSMLREMAEDEDEFIFSEDEIPDWILYALSSCGLYGGWMAAWREQTTDERRVALCVMAEALADEGL